MKATTAFSPLLLPPCRAHHSQFTTAPHTRPSVLSSRPALRRTIPRAALSDSRPDQPSPPNRSLASLHELTERIADLLHVGSIHNNHLHCPKDAPLGYLHATTHVVVVFGKHLIRDQLTVEYAKRIVTLVKQIARGALNPDVICFTGGNGLNDDGTISEAAAGYSFFRNICEEASIDVSRFQYILEHNSHNTKENLRNVIEELRRRFGADALSACHFTLVSSDYHLIRIQEVHRLSPRQSVLFPLEVSASTWNCIFAAYQFCVSRDPATAFLGRAVVLANDLGILHVNLKGALDDREFVAKENLDRLNETFAKMREMYRVIDSRTSTTGGFRTDMRNHAETLELAIHHIREVHTLLGPLNETGASVPHGHLELAYELLTNAIRTMRSSMDPDRVLRTHDRMAIIEDMVTYVAEYKSDPNSPESWGSSGSGGESDEAASSDQDDVSLFDTTSNRPPNKKKPPTRMTTAMINEVTWRGGQMFKGNGKKIARDGPNIIIAADTASPAVTSGASRKSSQTTRRTAAHSDTLAGALARSLVSNKPPRRSNSRSTNNNPASRSRSTARKTQTRASTSSKKRKPSVRKLASPSHGDSS
ncbi:hypothetical protein BWQ96_07901 [Gracilariopsis chorda]|uniref:DUF218 domain-containing protein n=1 Tax=Gracilariopsis chorda TaxID=448386 RepID=A0A2V3IJY6_9FLOR|nr:hypothetical protein BWQ96_07901 [Gracilariopsis chorda]|eukprot:PXF42381.1 hypothetical protein BWQ96_07901 [Gracilariopsis chorda]